MEASNGTSAALVDEVYRTCRIDDRGPMLALLSDDVVFRIEGDPERLPFTGLWHGHAGVNEHLDRFDAEWEIPRFEPVDRATDGVHVAVRVDSAGATEAAGERPHSPRSTFGRPAAARSRNSIRCAIPLASNAAPSDPESRRAAGRGPRGSPSLLETRLPRRGHGFPGSHGPPEQRVSRRWLTRR